jgi:acyl-coenzyme A synthetase/AMP-(fatty) acid ligase
MSEHDGHDDGSEEESILRLFDRICFSFGDQDAILLDGAEAVCYYEIQEASKALASQLVHRYRPDYVLIECLGHAVAEAVSILACMRIGVPFVPVNVEAGDSSVIESVADALALHRREASSTTNATKSVQIVAICCCENDEDPLLGVFYQADIHRVVFVDPMGNMKEQIRVPELDPNVEHRHSDELYVLFTSGTSLRQPKAVVGSHQSTYRRLKWWRGTFSPSPRVARRTRLSFVGT